MKLIHVTEVMSSFTDFSMIKPDVLDYASERGTRVHDIVYRLLNKQWVPSSSITEDVRGYIDSFKYFQKLIKETVFAEETFTYFIYGLTGTVDFGGYLIDKPDCLTIIDWKTPLALQPTWKGQLAAYNRMVFAAGYVPERIGSLQLDPKGGPGKMTWYEDSAEVWEAYLCALTALRYFTK